MNYELEGCVMTLVRSGTLARLETLHEATTEVRRKPETATFFANLGAEVRIERSMRPRTLSAPRFKNWQQFVEAAKLEKQ